MSHRSNRNPNWDRACVITIDLWVLSCNWLCPIFSKWSIFRSWMMKMYLCCALRWAGHNPDLNVVWDQVLTALPTAWLFPPNLISPSLRRIKGGREEADLMERHYPVFLRWCLLESYSKFREGAGEMVQSVKCLLCKHGDLIRTLSSTLNHWAISPVSQHPCKKTSAAMHTWNPSAGEVEAGGFLRLADQLT